MDRPIADSHLTVTISHHVTNQHQPHQAGPIPIHPTIVGWMEPASSSLSYFDTRDGSESKAPESAVRHA